MRLQSHGICKRLPWRMLRLRMLRHGDFRVSTRRRTLPEPLVCRLARCTAHRSSKARNAEDRIASTRRFCTTENTAKAAVCDVPCTTNLVLRYRIVRSCEHDDVLLRRQALLWHRILEEHSSCAPKRDETERYNACPLWRKLQESRVGASASRRRQAVSVAFSPGTQTVRQEDRLL